jgi:sugar lactone lactonase YvrE
MSQIIVADYNNACLHILDQNGQFLRCVDNCGLVNPDGLSVDSEGRLWVGLHDSEVKVIQYTK